MREIKLRFWDKENNCMVYQNRENLYPFGIYKIICDLFTNFEFKLFKKDIISSFNSFEEVDSIKMQYAGMKDCNDREIYEGDIVRVSNQMSSTAGEVICKDYRFCIQHKYSWGNDYNYSSFERYKVFKDHGATIKLESKFEVIGNIYENPELLEEI